MSRLASAPLITAWEDCQGRTHAEVAIRLLQVAHPGHDDRQLAALSVGQRDRLLLDLRQAISGDALALRTSCPKCADEFELDATIDEFRRNHAAHDLYEITVDGFEVVFRLPTSADVAAVMREPGAAAQRAALWRRCVTCTLDGQLVDLDDLTDHVTADVEGAMDQIDQQAVAAIELDCPSCGHQWAAGFDIVPVLWTELNDIARHRLFEVHQLATAYGWSEEHVLSLSNHRRRYYLEQL